MILGCNDLQHAFGTGVQRECVLHGVTVDFRRGETCLLMGPSGSGKTTLLTILGCLLRPTTGRVWVASVAIERSTAAELQELRRTRIGFVFQQSQLLPFLSVKQNLEIVGQNVGLCPGTLQARIAELADQLSFQRQLSQLPNKLSGGQRQRVAVARAVLHRPPILLADEPTAALDWEHGQQVVRLLVQHAQEYGAVLLTVTHDPRLIPFFNRRLVIEEGRLTEAAMP